MDVYAKKKGNGGRGGRNYIFYKSKNKIGGYVLEIIGPQLFCGIWKKAVLNRSKLSLILFKFNPKCVVDYKIGDLSMVDFEKPEIFIA